MCWWPVRSFPPWSRGFLLIFSKDWCLTVDWVFRPGALLEISYLWTVTSPAFVLPTFVSSFLFMMVWCLLVWKWVFVGFKSFVYISVPVGDLIHRFNYIILYCLSQARPWIVVVPLFAFNKLRWEMVYRCVDSGGIVVYHSCTFLLILRLSYIPIVLSGGVRGRGTK